MTGSCFGPVKSTPFSIVARSISDVDVALTFDWLAKDACALPDAPKIALTDTDALTSRLDMTSDLSETSRIERFARWPVAWTGANSTHRFEITLPVRVFHPQPSSTPDSGMPSFCARRPGVLRPPGARASGLIGSGLGSLC
ncbi:MAG: hypothetical protein HC807_01270 [Gammaproteobacteria bacterium]|nr:hypothetical protein [Gammaproteobacteria bacterium]